LLNYSETFVNLSQTKGDFVYRCTLHQIVFLFLWEIQGRFNRYLYNEHWSFSA